MADAYTHSASPELAFQWKRVGLTFEGGNVLSKLALSERAGERIDEGAAPTAIAVLERARAEGDRSALRSLYTLTSNPDLPTWDAEAASGICRRSWPPDRKRRGISC